MATQAANLQQRYTNTERERWIDLFTVATWSLCPDSVLIYNIGYQYNYLKQEKKKNKFEEVTLRILHVKHLCGHLWSKRALHVRLTASDNRVRVMVGEKKNCATVVHHLFIWYTFFLNVAILLWQFRFLFCEHFIFKDAMKEILHYTWI